MTLFGGNLDPYEKSLDFEYPYHPNSNPKRIDVKEIDNLTLADYGFTPDVIRDHYMYGVKVRDPETGKEMGDAFYMSMLEVGIDKAEKALDINILPRISEENRDFYEQEFQSYMYVHAYQKPILQVEDLKLQFNGKPVYKYPANWWKVNHLAGHVQLFPTALMQVESGMSYNNMVGGYPYLAGMYPPSGATYAPQMIHLKYVSGMLPKKRAGVTQPWEMPSSLEQLVVKYALKEVFQIWGELIIGAGIGGKSLSIDGISESIETTQSAMYGGARARIIQLDEDIKELVDGLRSYYGYNMVSI